MRQQRFTVWGNIKSTQTSNGRSEGDEVFSVPHSLCEINIVFSLNVKIVVEAKIRGQVKSGRKFFILAIRWLIAPFGSQAQTDEKNPNQSEALRFSTLLSRLFT